MNSCTVFCLFGDIVKDKIVCTSLICFSTSLTLLFWHEINSSICTVSYVLDFDNSLGKYLFFTLYFIYLRVDTIHKIFYLGRSLFNLKSILSILWNNSSTHGGWGFVVGGVKFDLWLIHWAWDRTILLHHWCTIHILCVHRVYRVHSKIWTLILDEVCRFGSIIVLSVYIWHFGYIGCIRFAYIF